MQTYFKISEQNMISHGIANGHEYIVYCLNKSVNVNTYFQLLMEYISVVHTMTENYAILLKSFTI